MAGWPERGIGGAPVAVEKALERGNGSVERRACRQVWYCVEEVDVVVIMLCVESWALVGELYSIKSDISVFMQPEI